MEKQPRKQTSKKAHSQLKSEPKAQKALYISKLKHAQKVLKSKAEQIIVPLMKIQKKISLKFDVFNKDYNDIIKKAEVAYKEINTHLEENKNDNMNLTDIQLNQKYANDHENMIKFYENVAGKLDLFTNIINSNEYNNVIQEFNNTINENDYNDNNDNDDDLKNDLDNIEKNYLILRKNSKKNKIQKLIGINSNKILKKLGTNKKQKKLDEKKSNKKTKKNSLDLLESLQNEYKDNHYIQKISKTFLKRRLFKNVIYRHIFDYEEDGTIKEDKLRSSGESTIYKYGKFIIKFKNDDLIKDICDKLIKYFEPELKQSFIKSDYDNKQLIIAGKLSNLINEFLDKIIRKNLYQEYNVVKITVEFYEFYEELVNEFNNNESNVVINCDEKILNHLKEDWESLNLVRDYVKKSKTKLNFNDENAINDANENNINKDVNDIDNNNVINMNNENINDENQNNENKIENIINL